MIEHSLLRAIREDPDNDAPRLAFADGLETHGQPERAEWIRASCDYARLRYGDERWQAAMEREMTAFRRCKPPWFEYLSNIDQRNDRGVFRFIAGETRSGRGPAPVKRLGKTPWLGQALDEGWLLRIELHWDDGSLAPLVAKWKEPAARVPLLVRPAPQIEDDALRRVLALPQLEGLDLSESYVLRNETVKSLAQYPNLVDLTLELRLVDPATVDAVLAQLPAMPALRRLHLKSDDRPDRGTRPDDADLLRLQHLPRLKRLYLSACPAVTDAGIEALRGARPGLVVTRA